MPSGRRTARAAPRCRGIHARGHPLSPIVVRFPVSAERAFDYLVDPHHRPDWQSSLRSVRDVAVDGSAWIDVTMVPGVRPRMRTTVLDRPHRWVEEGDCGPFSAQLSLTFERVDGREACLVSATFAISGLRLGGAVSRIARPAVAADLRRAARLV